ncbi:MAG: cytochrome c-type biogenesis protein [Burkholderiales bacterium]|nr:cytochrome c-type biogenesis protein CcmH [Betaproteobacteria bacterium]
MCKSLISTGVFSRFGLKMAAEWRVWFSVVLPLACGAYTSAAASVVAAAFVFLSAGVVSPVANAQVQTPEAGLPSPEVAKRLKTLESELRCLVCQNQTLAESPAGLAGDLRREVRSLVEQGKSDTEIKAFLRARYGDFVLYKPPVDPKTYLLWFGPFGLLLIGAASGWLVARRRGLAARVAPQVGEVPSTPEKSKQVSSQQRARALLDDDVADKDGKR